MFDLLRSFVVANDYRDCQCTKPIISLCNGVWLVVAQVGNARLDFLRDMFVAWAQVTRVLPPPLVEVDEDAYGGMIPMYVIERGGNIILDPWMLPPLIPILPPGTWSDSSSDDADTDARIHDIEDVD